MTSRLVLIFCVLFSLNSVASVLNIDSDAAEICKQAHLDMGNGNFRTSHTIYKTSDHLLALSHNTLDLKHFVSFIEKKSGNQVFRWFLDTYKAQDIEFHNNKAYIVAFDKKALSSKLVVIEFNDSQVLDIKQHDTHNLQEEETRYKRAYGLSKAGDNIYIAHGEMGVSVFDTNLEKHINHFRPNFNPDDSHRSYITDLVAYEDKLILGVDNITYNFGDKTRAYEGYVAIDKDSGEILKKISINQKKEALHEPKLFIDGDHLIMNTMFLHFTNNITKLLVADAFTPERRIYRYKIGKPIGLAEAKNGKLTGCFRDDQSQPVVSILNSQKL